MIVQHLLRLARRLLALQVFDVEELHDRLPSAYNSLDRSLKRPGMLTCWFDSSSDLQAADEEENHYQYDDISGRWSVIEDVTDEVRRERPELPMPLPRAAAILVQAARLAMKLNITNPHMEPSRRDQVGRAAYDFAQDHIGEKDPQRLFQEFSKFMSMPAYRQEQENDEDFATNVAARLREKYRMPMPAGWTH